MIYDIFFKYAYKNNKSFLSLSYNGLLLHPRRTIEDISEFLGLTLSVEEIKNAIDFISDRT
jgi:hypothetical protein